MPCPLVPEVIINRVRRLEFMHERRQIPPRCLNQEVDMLCEAPDYVKLAEPAF